MEVEQGPGLAVVHVGGIGVPDLLGPVVSLGDHRLLAPGPPAVGGAALQDGVRAGGVDPGGPTVVGGEQVAALQLDDRGDAVVGERTVTSQCDALLLEGSRFLGVDHA